MLKRAYIILILMVAASFTMAQKPMPVFDFDEFEPYLHRDNDTTYVVNFWATWCKPCIKELPAFEMLNEKYSDKPVKVLLVSLDFIKHYNTKLIPFIQDRDLQSEVLLLNDPRSNRWINRVSPEWSGAIPATVIYQGNNRGFYERSFTLEELEEEMKKYLD